MNVKEKLVAEGINYLRMMSQAERMGEKVSLIDLADEMNTTVLHIKEAIAAAKEQKELGSKIPTVTITQPSLKIHREFITGYRQKLKAINVEFLKEIVVKFEEGDSEFTTLLPVKITVKRL